MKYLLSPEGGSTHKILQPLVLFALAGTLGGSLVMLPGTVLTSCPDMRATTESEGTKYRMCRLKFFPEEKAFGSTYPLFTPPDPSWENKTGGIVTISYVILFSAKKRSVKDASCFA